ncbi:MAG: hypothetical protein AMXMBFR4_00800 [Candidatus Hydrogenedentota bacterium]
MNIFSKVVSSIVEGKTFALATVIRASGSTPQKTGARAIFEPGGAIHGTLGGGCLEAESRRRALRALDDKRPLLFDLNLDDDYGWDDGLICGGKVRVFIEPDAGKHRAAFQAAATALERGRRGVLVTRIVAAENFVQVTWLAEDVIATHRSFPGGDVLMKCLNESKPALHLEKDSAEHTLAEVYVEPVEPSPVLLIAGGGHVGQAVARLGAWLGFDVVVIDDRPAFTRSELYPEQVRTICGDIPREVAAFPITPSTYIVIVTRGHRHDGVVLKECIHSDAAYLGMIGSKRKAHMIRKGLIEDGFAAESDFDRVKSPIGLDIGALTIEEIAVSIVSELVAVRRKRSGAAEPLSVYTPA